MIYRSWDLERRMTVLERAISILPDQRTISMHDKIKQISEHEKLIIKLQPNSRTYACEGE
jgi:hypothetical protein